MQLRAAYETFFESITASNKLAEKQGKEPIKKIAMTTLSTGVFDYPKGPGAQVRLEVALQYLSKHPEMELAILNAHDEEQKEQISTRLNQLGKDSHGKDRYEYFEQGKLAPIAEQIVDKPLPDKSVEVKNLVDRTRTFEASLSKYRSRSKSTSNAAANAQLVVHAFEDLPKRVMIKAKKAAGQQCGRRATLRCCYETVQGEA